MANTILLIGLEEDAHIREVQKQIKKLDSEVKVVLFNPHSDGHFIEITAGNVSELSSGCVIVVDSERITAKSIKSVWYYLKPPMPPQDEDLQGRVSLNTLWLFVMLLSYIITLSCTIMLKHPQNFDSCTRLRSAKFNWFY